MTVTVAVIPLTAGQVGALAAFGGGILTALLIQDPKRAPIPFLTSNTVGLTWTICWWLINYFPGNLAAKAFSFPPLRITAKVRLDSNTSALFSICVHLGFACMLHACLFELC